MRRAIIPLALGTALVGVPVSTAFAENTGVRACEIVSRADWRAAFGPGKPIFSFNDPSNCDYIIADTHSMFGIDVSYLTPGALARNRAHMPGTIRMLPGLGAGAFVSYGRGRNGSGYYFMLEAPRRGWIVTVSGGSPHHYPVPRIVRLAGRALSHL